jgi:hypothetical protein
MTTPATTQDRVRRVVHVFRELDGLSYQITPMGKLPGPGDPIHGPFADAHDLGKAVRAAFPKKEHE